MSNTAPARCENGCAKRSQRLPSASARTEPPFVMGGRNAGSSYAGMTCASRSVGIGGTFALFGGMGAGMHDGVPDNGAPGTPNGVGAPCDVTGAPAAPLGLLVVSAANITGSSPTAQA